MKKTENEKSKMKVQVEQKDSLLLFLDENNVEKTDLPAISL